MKHCIAKIVILVVATAILLPSCTKYKDTTAKDPGLTNPYCNDPNAVNYNWGFPGKIDNTTCFYPTDIFKGVYEFHDSVFLVSNGLFVHSDTFILTINKINQTKFTVGGLCVSGGTLSMTAGADYVASIDTAIGDTTTQIRGQQLCSVPDTINGTLTKDRLVDTIMYIDFLVAADTGVITRHTGTAVLKHK